MKTQLVLPLVMLALSACAGLVQESGYTPLRLSLAGSDAAILSTIQEVALQQRWQLVRVDAGRGQVEALAPAEDLYGAVTRERWLFTVHGGTVEIRRVFEVRFDDAPAGDWQSASAVCRTYEYSREHEQSIQLQRRFVERMERTTLLSRANTHVRRVASPTSF